MSLVQRRQSQPVSRPESSLGRGGIRNDDVSLRRTAVPQIDNENSPRLSSDETSTRLIIMGYQHLLCFVVFMYTLLMIGRIGFGWTPGQKTLIRRPEDDIIPIDPGKVIIVTAYFDIPSRRPSPEYAQWIQHMMLLEDNMVIFCEPDLVHVFQEVRQHRPTYFVPMKFNETVLVMEHSLDFWEHQTKLEEGADVVSKGKGHFLERAIGIDAFPTPGHGHDTFFAWVGIGYLRTNLLDYKHMIQFLPKELGDDQVLLLDERRLVKQDQLGGGFIGGYKKGLERWIGECHKISGANKDRVFGKDQSWYEPCANNSGLCVLVAPNDRYGDAGFYMGPYLHGIQRWGVLDRLRRVWEKSMLRKLLRWATEPRLNASLLRTAVTATARKR